MDPKALRGWLLCQPRPVKLHIVRAEESESRVLEIQPSMSFADIAKTVVALSPERVEALDKDGQLIRVFEDDEEEEEEPEADFEVAADKGSAQLIIFAKLLADAYKHSTTVAFGKLGELFSASRQDNASQAKTIDTLQKLLMKQAFEAEGSGGGIDSGGSLEQTLLQAFMQGAAKKQAETAATTTPHNGTTNGAPTKGDA